MKRVTLTISDTHARKLRTQTVCETRFYENCDMREVHNWFAGVCLLSPWSFRMKYDGVDVEWAWQVCQFKENHVQFEIKLMCYECKQEAPLSECVEVVLEEPFDVRGRGIVCGVCREANLLKKEVVQLADRSGGLRRVAILQIRAIRNLLRDFCLPANELLPADPAHDDV